MPVTLTCDPTECPVKLESILLKPELADVQISVSCDKETRLFHAHKLVLAVGSEVFKTMFFGSVPQPNPVVITDSMPAAFEAFLRFLYTGTTTIDDAEAFPLLNLAKKYLVGSLSGVVMNYVEECITSENVGQLVLSGQTFLDDAPLRFWESVECHGEALLKSEEFLLLRKDTVQELLQRELEVEEMLVYERAVSWAKAECVRQHVAVDGEALRTALDGIVHQIRFPTMTAAEFARGPASEGILTSEEKVELFKWLTAHIPQSIFPHTPRLMGSSYITAKLLLGPAVLATKEICGTTNENTQPIPVNFDKGIKIFANKRYTASVVSNGSTYYGYTESSSKAVATKNGSVIFSFMESDVASNTSVAHGQIPQILFRA